MVRRLLTAILLFATLPAFPQYNIKKVMEEGRSTLDMGYYLVAMELFNRVVSLKPNEYEAWFLMGKAKFHLDDFEGAEQDCTSAILLNPYIRDIYELRAMCRVRVEKYDSAIVDYTSAIDIDPNVRDTWFNRAYCYYRSGHRDISLEQLEYVIKRWPDFLEAKALKREVESGRMPSQVPDRWRESSRSMFTTGKDKWKLK